MPEAPLGGASRLYRDLLKRYKDRKFANFIYAAYKSNNVADIMQNAKIDKNNQGEHNLDDVIKFFDLDKWGKDIADISNVKSKLEITDVHGNDIDFTNAEEALQKAENINSNYKGLAATVVQHGDIYNVLVNEKNSRTFNYANGVNERLRIWDVYKQAFNGVGVDITSAPKDLLDVFNAMNTGLAQYLRNLVNVDIGNLYRKEALALFFTSQNTQSVKNLVTEFGSIEDAAQALSDFNHGSINLTDPQKRLLLRAVKEAKNFQGVDMNGLVTQVNQLSKNIYSSSPEENIKATIHKLNKKYNIGINEIPLYEDNITSLSEAASNAVILLQRQIRQLEKVKGDNAEGKRLEGILHSLMTELSSKRYYSGVLKFLGEAASQIGEIDNLLLSVPQTGTETEIAFGTARVLQNIKTIKKQYFDILSVLADENLTIDESIPKADIDNIRQSARSLLDNLNKNDSMINKLTKGLMSKLMLEIVGNTTPDGQSMINALKMGAADSSYLDYLYSMGRASNPIIGAMGYIIRNAQASRDEKLNKLSERIRKANDRLTKAGHTSEFMYEDDGHIISDINWELYKETRKAQLKSFYAQGLRSFDLKQAIEDWEDQNTEDRIVDIDNGRTEKVPNTYYRKIEDFRDGWTTAQNEYYDTMMQIKGEIGSILPPYAQKQYLPPQLRRNFLDAVGNAKSLKDIGKAIRNKVQDFYKIREDDENYNMNGIIDGDEYKITEGDFDNTPLRQIPIFHINRVEQGELLKDFSSGLQALASTALNYDAINDVVDTIEFMGDFAKGQIPIGDKDSRKGDIVEDKSIRVFRNLREKGKNSNTEALIDGFIAQHIYGQKRDPKENKTWAKIFGNILAYTSFKGLATNVKGAFANWLMGEFQMMIEAGAGEFYGGKDYLWAHTKLFGGAGVGGEIMELLTNNMSHKSSLMREKFDPLHENYSDKSHKRYYNSMFRQLLSKDCSFIGYSSGEFLIHYVNMYALLHHEKVKLNGKEISLFDAYEVTDKVDGNAELRLKAGVTDKDGNPITEEYERRIKNRLGYLNQSTHGAMNEEDKGLIHQRWWGRGIMNFRQWMVEHYSRRFRSSHFDYTLKDMREGYYTTYFNVLFNEDTKDTWNKGQHLNALGMFMKDWYIFTLRSQTQWHNLNDMQKYNIKRVQSEMLMYVCLLGLSFMLGAPDDHKKEWWRRWWIYQVNRALMDTEVSMPNPKAIGNILTVINSPMASLNTMNSLLYLFYGLTNGDLFETIKSGDHKGENRYWRNLVKYDLPFFKDWEQMQNLDSDEAIFKVFETSPSNH